MSVAQSHINEALNALRIARDYLKAAQCPNTLARVRSAIESCEGALRNQRLRDNDAFWGHKRRQIKTAKRRNLPGARQWSIRTGEMRTDPYATANTIDGRSI